jgi:outer membrane cobalamin receptor
MKKADHDYAGHRVKAMNEVEIAGRTLGLELGGEAPARERQWKSDEQIIEARRLLVEARDKLEARDRDRVAAHVEVAIKELDLGLNASLAAAREPPRQELVHAFLLMKKADRDYAGHRVKALNEVEKAGKALGLELVGEAPERERQWKSDEQLIEARRLLVEARDKLEARDRERAAVHVEVAIRELDEALKVK